MLNNFNHG